MVDSVWSIVLPMKIGPLNRVTENCLGESSLLFETTMLEYLSPKLTKAAI